MTTQDVARAGMTWILNYSEWPITSPNEAALGLLLVWAVLLAQPKRERGVFQWLYLAVAPIILALTQSRSGLIAWSIFVLLGTRWWRWQTLLGILAIVGLVLLFAPEAYWGRLSRTLAPKGGSFEAFSSIIRVYGWQAALRIIADNPIFGVGYLGFRFVSARYNDLGIVINTAENYYLEVAAGMGLIGLSVLGVALVALWRIGAAVRAATVPGSHGHELARRHGPMVLALLTANLTGDQFVGLTGLAQLSLWIVLVVRAGHLSAAPAARG
jgi:O-antigen ligase